MEKVKGVGTSFMCVGGDRRCVCVCFFKLCFTETEKCGKAQSETVFVCMCHTPNSSYNIIIRNGICAKSDINVWFLC